MTKERWWLLLDENGGIADQIASPDNPVDGEHPQVSWPLARVVEAPRKVDLETEVWTKGAVEAVPERVEVQQLRELDSNRQQLAALELNPHPAIAVAHERKAEEARGWLLLDDKARAAADLDLLFPWLSGEAGERTAMSELARTILQNRNEAEAQLRAIDAEAIDAKARLRAAPTAIGKRRIADAALKGADE